MNLSYNKILVLAPHTDDAELGCGGTIARAIEEDTEVFVVTFSSGEASVPKGFPDSTLKQELFQAVPKLGVSPENIILYEYPIRKLSYHRQEILEDLVKLRRQINPDLVLLPSGHDLHQDHQVVHIEGLRAFKDISVLGYELPWNHINFPVQIFVPLKKHHIERKWQALQSYRSQFELGRSYFSAEFIEGLAKVRGVQIKVPWAEAFEVLRMRL